MASVDASTLLKQYPFDLDAYTRLAYTSDGSRLITAGPAAFLRLYDTADHKGEIEPLLIEPLEADAEVLSVDCSPAGDILVADNKGTVSLLEGTKPHGLKALITRCNLSTRDARFNRQGTKVAVASDELIVKIIDVRDTNDIQQLEGHTKAVRAVSWHPEGQILTTSGSDGTIRVWDLSSSEPLCVKTMDGVIPAEEPEDFTQCSAVWHPQGSYFVAATKAHEIAVIQRDTWSRIGTFSTEGHETAICALAWSANGNYLASAGKDGYVIVWDSKTRTPVVRTRLDEDSGVVTEMAWQSSSGANVLSVVTSNGNLVRWHSVIPSDRTHPTDLPRAAPPARAREPSAAPSRGERSTRGRDDVGDVDSLFGGDDDDWIIDDLGNEDGQRRPAASTSRFEAPSRSLLAAPAPRSKGQPAFQPGATLAKEKRRYLAFNEIGVVHAVERDSYQVITVDFHDQGARRGFHWEDYSSHTMASLGQHGVLTAGGEDIIAYRPYSTWTDATGEWTLHLPKDEKAVAIAMGPKLALVATDAGYLRFLTASGLQTHLVDLGRDVVAVAIGAEFAIVLHRPSAYAVDDLSYTVIDTESYEFVQSGTLPCFGDVTIKWLGFCDDEMPAIYKSNGVLSVLDRCRRPWQARWTPILDTRLIPAPIDVEAKLTYWPVWATSSQLHHVILKGEERQPSFPTPLTFAVDFQLPALGIDSAEGQTQERIMRSTIMTTHLRDSAAPEDDDVRTDLVQAEIALDKDLLQVMNLACKSDKLELALEAAKLISQPASLEAAIKLAAYFGLSGLRERIERLRERDGPAQPEKRESRWAPLMDERTVTKPVSAGTDKRSMVDLLAMPFDAERRARASSSRPAERTSRSAVSRQPDDDSGFSEDTEPLNYDDEGEPEDDGMEVENEMPPPPINPAGATTRNLFAKKAKAIPAPLSSSSAGNTPRPTHSGQSLKKSDSFFTRVEEQQPKGPKQATLFGSKPPPPPEPKKKGGRKRKSDETAGGDSEESAKAPRQTLADMFARAPSKTSILANEVTVEEDEEENEETQALVESPDSLTPLTN